MTLLTLLIYPFGNDFWALTGSLEKRETVNRLPLTVNRQQLTEIPSCRTADGDRRPVIVARCSSVVAREVEIPLCLPYLLYFTMLYFTYLPVSKKTK